MLGCFTSLTLQMKRIYSVCSMSMPLLPNLGEMMAYFDAHLRFRLPGGLDRRLSWGAGHWPQANPPRHLPEAGRRPPSPGDAAAGGSQAIPQTMMGFLPKSGCPSSCGRSILNLGWRMVCWAKYSASAILEGTAGKSYRSHTPTSTFCWMPFPLRMLTGGGGIINTRRSSRPGQPTTPSLPCSRWDATASQLSQRAQAPPARPFLMTHGLDGYSIAMDFHPKLAQPGQSGAVGARHGRGGAGRRRTLYFAKDSTLRPEVVQACQGSRDHRPLPAAQSAVRPAGC